MSSLLLLMTILYDSGFRLNLWNEVIGACILTLNQIPAHRSNKSPFELCKGQAIPLEFFRPIGNPTVFHSHSKKDKLEPRGDLGKLICFDIELKSYRILMNDGRMVESKNVEFLAFENDSLPSIDHDKLLIDNNAMKPEIDPLGREPDPEEPQVKIEEEEDEQAAERQDEGEAPLADTSDNEDEDIAEILVPELSSPVGCVLRDRTLQVKPVKYSCHTEDPKTFQKAVSGENSAASMGDSQQ
ncbi:hypothetical protein VP01_4712g2, partial [Puccinia sorghi]